MDAIRRHFSRREFLKVTGGTITAASTVGARPRPIDSTIPIATQMWVVREEAANDLSGVLKSLAGMGYQGVEFADDFFGYGIPEIRTMLDDYGLAVAGNHVYLESLLGDELPPTVEMHRALGATNLIVRSLRPEQYDSREAILRFASQLNDIAERLAPFGMRTGFHNHAEIFNSYDGEMAWNILADNTRGDVILQLDTGNAMQSEATVDVAELVRRNAGRTITTHIKPFSSENEAAYVGQDDLNWKTIIGLMETVGGTEWYIIEYEIEGTPPLQALKENLVLFKDLLSRV